MFPPFSQVFPIWTAIFFHFLRNRLQQHLKICTKARDQSVVQRQPFYRRGVNGAGDGAVADAVAVSAAGEEVVRDSWDLLIGYRILLIFIVIWCVIYCCVMCFIDVNYMTLRSTIELSSGSICVFFLEMCLGTDAVFQWFSFQVPFFGGPSPQLKDWMRRISEAWPKAVKQVLGEVTGHADGRKMRFLIFWDVANPINPQISRFIDVYRVYTTECSDSLWLDMETALCGLPRTPKLGDTVRYPSKLNSKIPRKIL